MNKWKKISLISLAISIICFSGLLLFNVVPVSAVALDNPIKVDSPQDVIGNLIKATLGITGSVALIMFIYGGILWLTSQGNEQRVEQGKKLIIWAAMGLAVIFTSYAIVYAILEAVGANPAGTTGSSDPVITETETITETDTGG